MVRSYAFAVRFARIGAAIVAINWPGIVVGAASASGGVVAAAPASSPNWAGYVVEDLAGVPVAFTSVTASWLQPKASCASGAASSAFWVGLGGYGPAATGLLQIGTDTDCTAAHEPKYYAWYDIPPNEGVLLRLKVAARDALTASVTMNSARTEVLFRIANRTTGLSYSKRLPVSSPDLTSAEWIAEAPVACNASGCRTVRLADFGSVAFTNVAAAAGGHEGTITHGGWTAVPIRLDPNAQQQQLFSPGLSSPGPPASTAGAAPKDLAAGGSSFRILWTAHASPPSNPRIAAVRR